MINLFDMEKVLKDATNSLFTARELGNQAAEEEAMKGINFVCQEVAGHILEALNNDELTRIQAILDEAANRMKEKENEEPERAYIINVKAVNLNSRDTEGDNINEDYLWHGEEAPVIGQRVLAENCYFTTEAIIINVEETTMEEVEDMELVSDAYVLEESYLPVVKVVYGGDYTNEIYAVWNEQGAMENGEWNDRDLPRAGCICALRLGYKNYVEASILSIEEMSEEEIEELKEKETVYKAYDYDRMVLQRYGFDPDEDGQPTE